MWAIGVLAIITAVFGLVGSCCRARCCLGVYLVLAVLATAAQAGFVLYLFIDPAHAEREVAKYQRARSGAIKCARSRRGALGAGIVGGVRLPAPT